MIVERDTKKGTHYIARIYDTRLKKQVYSKTFRTRKEAVKAEARMIQQNEAGKSAAPKKCPTYQELFELWLIASRPHYAERTWRGHEYYWNHYVAPIFGHYRADTITTAQILKYKSKIEATPENEKIKGKLFLAPETVNKIISVMSLVFQFGRDVLKVIPESPMDHIKRNRVMQRKHVTWTPEEISGFLTSPAVMGSWFRPMIILAFTTGMRPGEICGLAESDLLPQRILTISRGYNAYGHVTELKTARSHRALSLSEPLYQLLADVLDRKHRSGFSMQNDFLFTGPHGIPVTPRALGEAFRGLLTEYNRSSDRPLPWISLYGARHSFATNLIISGKKSLLISEIMGNSVATMELHYAHLRETMHAAALEEYTHQLLPDS